MKNEDIEQADAELILEGLSLLWVWADKTIRITSQDVGKLIAKKRRIEELENRLREKGI